LLRIIVPVLLLSLAFTPLAASHEGPHPPTVRFVSPTPGDVMIDNDRTPGPVGPSLNLGRTTVVLEGRAGSVEAPLARIDLYATIPGTPLLDLLASCDVRGELVARCSYEQPVDQGPATARVTVQRLVAVATDAAGDTSQATMEYVHLSLGLLDVLA